MKLLAFIFFVILNCITFGSGRRSPLTVVNPVNIVTEQFSAVSCSNYADLSQLKNLSSTIFQQATWLAVNSSCAESLLQVVQDLGSSTKKPKEYAYQSKLTYMY